MAYVGGGWRSGQATDPAVNTGAVSTCTVSTLNPSTASRTSGAQSLTVTGTGFTNQCVVYANYSPQVTTFVSATQLTVARFSPMPDSGLAGAIPIGVVKPGEKISNTVNFTATSGGGGGTAYTETGRSITIAATTSVTDTLHVAATQAVRFNASTMRYTRSATGLATNFTMTCWVKLAVDQDAYSMFIGQDNAGANYYQVGTNATGTTLARDSTSGAGLTTTFDFVVGTWVFIGCVNDTAAGGNDIFGWWPVGGSWTTWPTGTGVTVTGPADANTFYIGKSGFGTWWNGSIAAVKVWTVALTDTELQAERSTYAAVKTANLWAAWSFRNGPQTTDDSGNGRTLTVTGTPIADTSGPPIT